MVSVIARPKKLGKFLNKLEQNEFDGFAVFGEADGVKLFGLAVRDLRTQKQDFILRSGTARASEKSVAVHM